MSDLSVAKGRVRSVFLGDTKGGEPYARIRLARDTGYFMDFDEPDVWPALQGQDVSIWYATQIGDDGYTWRVVLDVEDAHDAPA
jgi:hypothetical protein